MAEDTVQLDALEDGDDVAVDLVDGKMYQYAKMTYGADGTINKVTSTATNPLPVALATAEAADLANVDTATTSIDGKITACDTGAVVISSGTVTASGPVTDAELRATPVPMSITDTSFAVADGSALGEGVLIQGDDGTNRKNINVHATTGDVQVDVTNTVTVDGTITAVTDITNPITANPASGTIDTVTTVTSVTNDVGVEGAAAENAAASGNPVLSGGRYDLSPRTLGDGDVGAVALDPDGAVHISDGGNTITVDGTVAVSGVATAANQLPDGHNVTVDNASIAVTNAGLTELAAAINASQLDVNIATDSVGIVTQYTEDAVAAADPIGNAQILVREDAPTSIAVDGDNVARRGTQYGAAYTQIVDSSGNFINTFGGSGGTATADDADFVAGTTQGTIAQGVYESTPSSVTDGDVGAVGISSTRRLLTDSNVTLDAETTKVIGTVRVASGGIASGGIVDLPLPAGAATQATLATIDTDTGNIATAVQLIDNPIVAHDAAASGSTGVNMAGGYATNNIKGITQVANADASHIVTDLNGVTVTRNGTTLEELIHNKAQAGVTATTSTAVTNFTAVADVHNYVTSVTVFNSNASTNTFVKLQDGSGGGTEWIFPAPATGGTTHNFDPPLKQTTANTALYFATDAAVSTVYVFVNGFQAQG